MAQLNKKNISRSKDFGSGKSSIVLPPEICSGVIEYKMGRLMASTIIQEAKSNRQPQEILCDYVNNNFGLKGYCIKVIIDGE